MDTYQRWNDSYVKRVLELKNNIKNLSRGQDEVYYLLKNELDKLSDLRHIYNIGNAFLKSCAPEETVRLSGYLFLECYRTSYLLQLYLYQIDWDQIWIG